jgi:cytidylate kinase
VTPARVLITGPTASGKSTLARAVAGRLGASVVTEETLRPAKRTSVEADQIAAIEALRLLRHSSAPVVVEHRALHMQLEPTNDTLVIALDATTLIRADRLEHTTGLRQTTFAERDLHVRSADRASRQAMRAALGVDLSARTAQPWRCDLILACPDRQTCADPHNCRAFTTQLAMAALDVYQHHLGAATVTQARDAGTRLTDLIRVHPGRVRHCTAALTDLAAGAGVDRWRNRFVVDLSGTETTEDVQHA